MKKLLIVLALIAIAIGAYLNLKPARTMVEKRVEAVKEGREKTQQVRQMIEKVNAEKKSEQDQMQNLMPGK